MNDFKYLRQRIKDLLIGIFRYRTCYPAEGNPAIACKSGMPAQETYSQIACTIALQMNRICYFRQGFGPAKNIINGCM